MNEKSYTNVQGGPKCLQSVPVKEFRKSVNNWQKYRQM